MIELEEAWERLSALAPHLGGETVPVNDAAGRYLVDAVDARRTQPAADLSVMDGFAVSGPGPWRIVGDARAGHPFAGTLRPGEAVRISTGAACPEATGAIIPVEDAKVEGEAISAAPPEPGRWIRRRGFDFGEGDPLLPKGTFIGPAQLALVRAAGHGALTVGRQPRITIIECGDELVGDPVDCPAHLLPASNGAMVAAMARTAGARVQTLGPLPDNRAEMASALSQAREANVIVTTAGASVGEHDHVRGALEDCGAELAFWRVAIRPGKPLMVASLGDTLVLGLPGNPASSFVTAFLFLLPLVRAMQGALDPKPLPFRLPLATPLPAGCERREFLRGRLVEGRVHLLPERDSSALRTLGTANLLIDRAIDSPAAEVGDLADCHWLGGGSLA